MIDHTSPGVTDYHAAVAFYTACLALEAVYWKR